MSYLMKMLNNTDLTNLMEEKSYTQHFQQSLFLSQLQTRLPCEQWHLDWAQRFNLYR